MQSAGDSASGPSCQQVGVESEPTRANKRKRSARATAAQLDVLLSKIEAQPFLASKKFPGVLGRENYEHAWKEVAKDLNNVKNGAIKTAEQWMTVWRDFKSRACVKAAKLNRERRATGNLAIETAPLTELEQRIISVVGSHYAVGSSCPDSMPEGREESTLQDLELAAEDATVEDLGFFPPIELLETEVPEPDPVDIEIINLPPTAASPIASTSRARPSEIINLPPTAASPIGASTSRARPSEIINLPPTAASPIASTSRARPSVRPTTSPRQTQRNKNLNPRRTLQENMTSAREDFLAVAESNSQSMKMLAEAAKVHAEAAKEQSQASIIFARAADKIADALLLLAQKK